MELGKTLKLEWHKASNQRTRCLRITAKEEKAVRGKLQVWCAGFRVQHWFLGSRLS